MSLFEVVDLRSGKVLHAGEDREAATDALQRHQEDGVPFDSLDLVRVDGGTRQSQLVREHQSAARLMMAEAAGQTYRSYQNLAEAVADPDAAVIIEGDYGGQILVTAPLRLIDCTEERLNRLAQELENLTWPENGGDSQAVLFEPAPVGTPVAGGMGGGVVMEDVWVHEELAQLGLASAIRAILRAERQELPEPDPDLPAEVRDGILRAYDDRADVFSHVFGFPAPTYMASLNIAERQSREAAYAPPPTKYTRWYWSTYRAVARRAGYSVPATELGRDH
jgi:hypothetical protein